MYLQAVLAAIIFAVGVGSGIKWHVGIVASRDLAAVNETFRKAELRTKTIDTAAVRHEQYKARVELREVEVLREVDRVVEKPVYSNVCLDESGMRVIARDIAARNTPGEPAPTLPPTPRTGKTGWQNNAALDTRSDPTLQLLR